MMIWNCQTLFEVCTETEVTKLADMPNLYKKKLFCHRCQAIHGVWTECWQILQILQTKIRCFFFTKEFTDAFLSLVYCCMQIRFKSSAWNTKSSSLPSSFHCLDLTFLCIIAALRSKCLKRAPSLRSFLSSSSFYRDKIFRSSFYKRNFCQSIKCLNLLHRVKHTNCKILTALFYDNNKQ